MQRSIVQYFYEPDGPSPHKCGYCKSEDSNVSNGMWAHQMTCQDYKDLIDRGWRRSGKYCYKPLMNRTCCPLYTIRCDAAAFQLSKSQKVVMKKFNHYLEFGLPKKSEASSEKPTSSEPKGTSSDGTSVKTPKTVKPGVGQDPNKPPCRKAKELRRERKMEKQQQSQSKENSSGGPSAGAHAMKSTASSDHKKSIEELLPNPEKYLAHKLEIKLIQSSPPSPEFQATFKESYALYRKYQVSVHKDKPSDVPEKQFTRFLVDSPLMRSKNSSKDSVEYGSYHQHYYVDGKLIMVGVVDILPSCLSSVYVFYDPDFMFLSPGVYSALTELAAIRGYHKTDPSFHYYYMGYYVHSCPKMNYKGHYTPSFLVCPETYRWIPIEKCKEKLNAAKYCRFEEDPEVKPLAVDSYIGQTLVLYQGQPMPYSIFRVICHDEADHKKIKEYAELAGKNVSSRMLLYIE